MNKSSSRFKAHVKQMSQRPGGVSEGKAVAMMVASRPLSSAAGRKHAGKALPKATKNPVSAPAMDGNKVNPKSRTADDKTTFE